MMRFENVKVDISYIQWAYIYMFWRYRTVVVSDLDSIPSMVS